MLILDPNISFSLNYCPCEIFTRELFNTTTPETLYFISLISDLENHCKLPMNCRCPEYFIQPHQSMYSNLTCTSLICEILTSNLQTVLFFLHKQIDPWRLSIWGTFEFCLCIMLGFNKLHFTCSRYHCTLLLFLAAITLPFVPHETNFT